MKVAEHGVGAPPSEELDVLLGETSTQEGGSPSQVQRAGGEERGGDVGSGVEVVRGVADACGDDFELCSYERFGKLEVASESLARKPNQMGTYKKKVSTKTPVVTSQNFL